MDAPWLSPASSAWHGAAGGLWWGPAQAQGKASATLENSAQLGFLWSFLSQGLPSLLLPTGKRKAESGDSEEEQGKVERPPEPPRPLVPGSAAPHLSHPASQNLSFLI